MTNDQSVSVIRRIQSDPDGGTREDWDRILLQYRPFIFSIIRLHRMWHAELIDLEMELLGFLVELIRRYDPSRDVPVIAYLSRFLKGRVHERIRQNRKGFGFTDVPQSYVRANTFNPAPEQEAINEDIASSLRLTSFSCVVSEEGNALVLLEETIEGSSEDRDGYLDLMDCIEKIGIRFPREKEIILWLLCGYTLQEIGDQMGMSQSRVLQLRNAARAKIARQLFPEGVRS